MSSAVPTTRALENALRPTLATTCPVSTAELAIGIVWNRSMTPPTMSLHTPTAVVAEPNPVHSKMIPGTT